MSSSKRSKGHKKAEQPSSSALYGSSSGSGSDVSFLFVVNDLVVNRSDPANQGPVVRLDRWGNVLPPDNTGDTMGYETEYPSVVLRYKNGMVTSAETEYWWERNMWPKPGSIRSLSRDDGSQLGEQVTRYKECTIFRGWRFLPFLILNSDATTTDTLDPQNQWHTLHFGARPTDSGVVSQLTWNGPPYAAGRDAAWIPSLIPSSFSNPYPDAPVSRGLAGELPMILGLMALSQERGQGAAAFHLWKNRRWTLPREPPHIDTYPGPDEFPRGMLVHVSLDPDNQGGSTEEALQDFEWNKIIVKG